MATTGTAVTTIDDPAAALKVLVVGGSSAIGLAVVRRFAAAGWMVLATCFRSDAQPPTDQVTWQTLDITDDADIRRFALRLEEMTASFDAVVLVTGSIVGKKLEDYVFAEVDAVMQTNFNGPVKLLNAISRRLNEGSTVVMFSSISGERGSYDPVYAGAKGAIIAFVKSMAVQMAPRTRFMALAPGLVEDSGMFDSMSSERRDIHRQATPLGRLIQPAEVADIVFDLTSEHWAHANGSCVRINGGAYV